MDQDKGKKKKKAVQKYNLNEVEDIWSSLLSDESSDLDDELFEGESQLYGDSYPEPSSGYEQARDSAEERFAEEDHVPDENLAGDVLDVTGVLGIDGELTEDDEFSDESFADDAPGEEQALEEIAEVSRPAEEFSAVLMFAGGMRQEVARAKLFHPQENSILLIDEETNDELVISFDQLSCIQISGLPAGISDRQRKSGRKEIIETIDGNTHHVLVGSRQELSDLLCCFSREDQTDFPVTLFPISNIRKRSDDRQLTDILLEKRFISKTILKKALQEFEQLKGMTIEKIIAQKARIPIAEIEEALDNARQNQMLGMQPGEILLISGLVNEEQILDALEYHEHIDNLELDQFLIEKGIVKEVEVYVSLAEKHKIPFVDLRQRKIPREFLTLLPDSMIAHHEILPLVKKDDILLVATHLVNPTHLSKAIAKAADCKQVKYVLSPPSQIRKIIQIIGGKS